MKKVLSYILISLVLFVNLFAPFSVGGEINNVYAEDTTDINVDNYFNISITANATDKTVSGTATVTDGSTTYSGAYSDLSLYIQLTDTNGKEVSKTQTIMLSQKLKGTGVSFSFSDGISSNTNYLIKAHIEEMMLDGFGGGESRTIGNLSPDIKVKTNEIGNTTTVTQGSSSVTNSGNSEAGMPACSMTGGILGDGTFTGCIAQAFYYVLFIPTSYLFALSGTFFDYTFSYSVQDTSYRSSFVVSGWGLVRDFCNMFFIFILLYTAIATTLSLHGFKTKETIINVVIIGLLINFSLLATQIIIDASNITARVFYNSDAIKITEKDANGVTKATPGLEVGENGIIPLSAGLVSKVNPQNIILHSDEIGNVGVKGDGTTVTDNNDGSDSMDAGRFILIVIMAAAVNIVGFIVFLSIGLVFVARVVGLWLSMILAPLAFFTYILPSMSGIKMIGWKNWWPETLKLAFLAPVFIFFMFLILKFLETDLVADTATGNGLTFFIATFMPFAFIMILLMKAKKIATEMAGEMGAMAAKAGGAVGGMALGGMAGFGAMAMRGTIGRLGSAVYSSASVQEAAAKKGVGGAFARLALRGGEKAGSGSFDARNTKLGSMGGKNLGVDLGKAKEGGFVKARADKTALRQKRAKELELSVDSKPKQELMQKQVALKQMQNDSAHALHEIDGRLEAARQKKSDAGVGTDAEKAAIKEIADLTKEKGEINNGGKVTTDNHGHPLGLDANGNQIYATNADGTTKYNTTNGRISQTEVDKTIKEATDAEALATKAGALVETAEAEAAEVFSTATETLRSEKERIDEALKNELSLVDNKERTVRAALPPGMLLDQKTKDSLAAERNAVTTKAQTLKATSEGKFNKAVSEANAKVTTAEAKLETAEAEAVEASNKATATLTEARNGTGRSINDLKLREIPSDEFHINQRNNKVRGEYADYLGSNLNKVANFLQSGGTHSFKGDNEAIFKIKTDAKIESSGGGGGHAAAPKPAAHAPAPAAAHAPAAASHAPAGGGHDEHAH